MYQHLMTYASKKIERIEKLNLSNEEKERLKRVAVCGLPDFNSFVVTKIDDDFTVDTTEYIEALTKQKSEIIVDDQFYQYRLGEKGKSVLNIFDEKIIPSDLFPVFHCPYSTQSATIDANDIFAAPSASPIIVFITNSIGKFEYFNINIDKNPSALTPIPAKAVALLPILFVITGVHNPPNIPDIMLIPVLTGINTSALKLYFI